MGLWAALASFAFLDVGDSGIAHRFLKKKVARQAMDRKFQPIDDLVHRRD
jgi:hypothetical protein